MLQLFKVIILRPVFNARPISESVPGPPPMDMTADPARATKALRACPRPVGSATVKYRLPSEASFPGSNPIVIPPACWAPRHAASITPLRPPQTRTTPSSASRRPTSSASCACSGVHSPAPITDTTRERCSFMLLPPKARTTAWCRLLQMASDRCGKRRFPSRDIPQARNARPAPAPRSRLADRLGALHGVRVPG